MKAVVRLFLLVALCVAGICYGAQKSDAEAIAEAQKIATRFLAAVDGGNVRSAANFGYEIEHRDYKSGKIMRMSAVSPGLINVRVQARRRLGRLLERKLEKAEVMSEVSRFPKGKYVRFTYALKFGKKDVTELETLTIKVDYPNRWKIVSY